MDDLFGGCRTFSVAAGLLQWLPTSRWLLPLAVAADSRWLPPFLAHLQRQHTGSWLGGCRPSVAADRAVGPTFRDLPTSHRRHPGDGSAGGADLSGPANEPSPTSGRWLGPAVGPTFRDLPLCTEGPAPSGGSWEPAPPAGAGLWWPPTSGSCRPSCALLQRQHWELDPAPTTGSWKPAPTYRERASRRRHIGRWLGLLVGPTFRDLPTSQRRRYGSWLGGRRPSVAADLEVAAALTVAADL